MTKECFMTIRFENEVVRRHFLNDIMEKVVLTQYQEGDASGEVPFYDNDVSYAFPDQPYFETRIPDICWNFLAIIGANQVVNQGISGSKYGENWCHHNRLLAKKNTPDSVLDEEWSRKKDAASGVR